MLTQELVRSLFDYNPETGVFVWRVNRGSNKLKGKQTGYVDPSHGYVKLRVNDKGYYAHHVAWVYVTGHWQTGIDHINGDRADNRFANLRVATHAQNLANRAHLNSNNTTGFRGVTLHKDRYKAAIMVKGKRIHLGVFNSAIEASNAFAEAARKHFGDFASG